ARLQRVRVAEGNGRQVHRWDGEHRQVEVRVGAGDRGHEPAAVGGENDLDRLHLRAYLDLVAAAVDRALGPAEDVLARQDVAGGRDHEAAAGGDRDVP